MEWYYVNFKMQQDMLDFMAFLSQESVDFIVAHSDYGIYYYPVIFPNSEIVKWLNNRKNPQ